jgi:hypothetical protein
MSVIRLRSDMHAPESQDITADHFPAIGRIATCLDDRYQ